MKGRDGCTSAWESAAHVFMVSADTAEHPLGPQHHGALQYPSCWETVSFKGGMCETGGQTGIA